MKYLLLIPFLCLLVSPAWAAIVCGDAIEYNDTTPPGATETISYTTPAGSNQMLIVGVILRDTNDTINSATHAGNAMTPTNNESFTTIIHTRMFYIVNPTSGTNNVVVTFSGATLLATAFVVFTCSGVNTAVPGHDATLATGTGTAVTVTVPNLVAGDVVVDMFGANIQAADPTEGANQTMMHEGADGTELGWGSSFQDGADGGVMSWTISSQEWGIQAVALTAAAAATIIPSSPTPPVVFQ